MKKITALLTIIILAIACSSNEIGNSKDVNPQTIYIDYTVEYEENSPAVSCIAQFRFAGKNGTTLILNEPAKIELDGKKMRLDSSSVSGAYYISSENVTGFEGKHELTYTDAANKVYHQHFTFHPLILKSIIASNLSKKQDLILSFSSQNENDVISVNIEDTARKTEDIDRIDTIKNEQIIISSAALSALKKGPVSIKITKTQILPLQEQTPTGGTMRVSVVLRERKSILKN